MSSYLIHGHPGHSPFGRLWRQSLLSCKLFNYDLKMGFYFLIFSIASGVCLGSNDRPPPLSTLVRESVYKKVVEERDIVAHAQLEEAVSVPQQRRYSYFALMLVRGSLKKVRSVITNYRLYSEMIPYVNKAEYSPKTHILEVEGGIWKYRLVSSVLFTEKSDPWIKFSIIGGHFRGLKGDLFFESVGEKGTLVYLRGEVYGSEWPPKFIIERGAEIVFGFTGRRMRSYIESHEDSQLQGEVIHDSKVPKPRRHF